MTLVIMETSYNDTNNNETSYNDNSNNEPS